MLEHGFVKIDRSITRWRWYQNANTFRVFFHLLMTANFDDRETGTLKIKRGQRVGGRIILANELGMTEQEVRTALQHLVDTREITISRARKFSVYTIINYDKYQSVTTCSPENQPDSNQIATRYQPHNKKEKESKRKKKNCDPPTQAYGEYGNVRLTDAQYARLIGEYGEYLTRTYIRRIDEWIRLRGEKPYKDFYLAIRNWIRRDNAQKEKEDAAYERFQGTAAAEGFI